MTKTSNSCASGEIGRRSGLKILRPKVSTTVHSCSPSGIRAFFKEHPVPGSCATVRLVPQCAQRLALARHQSTTFRWVLIGMVMAEVGRFMGGLKRRFGGCLDAGEEVSIKVARRFAVELSSGPFSGQVRSSCSSPRCVRPAHLVVEP